MTEDDFYVFPPDCPVGRPLTYLRRGRRKRRLDRMRRWFAGIFVVLLAFSASAQAAPLTQHEARSAVRASLSDIVAVLNAKRTVQVCRRITTSKMRCTVLLVLPHRQRCSLRVTVVSSWDTYIIRGDRLHCHRT